MSAWLNAAKIVVEVFEGSAYGADPTSTRGRGIPAGAPISTDLDGFSPISGLGALALGP